MADNNDQKKREAYHQKDVLELDLSAVVLTFVISTSTIQHANVNGGSISDALSCQAIDGTWNGIQNSCSVSSLTIQEPFRGSRNTT